LNCESHDEPIQILRKEFYDAIEISEQPHYGPDGTFNDFNINSIVKERIDYIFTKNLKIKRYRHVDDRRKNNLYISDHLPVLVEIIDTNIHP
jgi:endonuclease/exonuclease/phosphatase family metal-dependent hydrolase